LGIDDKTDVQVLFTQVSFDAQVTTPNLYLNLSRQNTQFSVLCTCDINRRSLLVISIPSYALPTNNLIFVRF